MREAPSVCICSKCGVTAPLHVARLAGWLVRERKGEPGRWVMRCPVHISYRARLAAGLPDRLKTQRIARLISRGLSVVVGGVSYYVQPGESSGYTMAVHPALFGERSFTSLEALCQAMSEIASLRTWRACS